MNAATGRAARAREIRDELDQVQGITGRRRGGPLPRYLLVQRYADTRRGGHAIVLGEDPDALLQQAHSEVWHGWIPVELHDLDHRTREALDLAIQPRRAVCRSVTIVMVQGRDSGPYAFAQDDDAVQFVAAVQAEGGEADIWDTILVEPGPDARSVIDAERDEPDAA
jgi:hypothetical protein